jgi:alpha-ketoglutarate-dependent taurine dioxygenase
VAEIGGIDISRPVEPTGMAALWDASDAHAVLVFRGQTLPQRSVSFAQFEREVIGERIRDKIAASKRNGMWMGVPPLG